ncbi:YopX family protein [Enterococcus sp. DIV0800]|uniref:YopX family protein n=1 Tax=unclassified Enterococcus TaxID=2608891 RepID=UPI003D300BF4
MKAKFRSWVENVRHPEFSFMQYEPEFNGEINKIFEKNGEIQHGVKVNYMQSTGLKDKNGVEIFEGDVLLYTSKSINYGDTFWHSYVQVYRMKSGAYRIKGEHIYDTELMGVRKNLEVVGNIYQSEELLSVDRFMTTDGIVEDGE